MALRFHSDGTAGTNVDKRLQTVAKCSLTIAQQWHSGRTAMALQVQKQTNNSQTVANCSQTIA